MTSARPLVSTGIEPLDRSLGGLMAERHYLVSGAPGAGKTTMALHFLRAGLANGERCAIVTHEDPSDLMAQADFLGMDLRSAARASLLSLVRYRRAAGDAISTSDPERMLEGLIEEMGGEPAQRIVFDSLLPFLDERLFLQDGVVGLAHLVENLGATSYLTVPGDVSEPHYRPLYDRIVSPAAGIFHLEVGNAGSSRRLSIRKLRQPTGGQDVFRLVIQPAVGMTEPSPDHAREGRRDQPHPAASPTSSSSSTPSRDLDSSSRPFFVLAFLHLRSGGNEDALRNLRQSSGVSEGDVVALSDGGQVVLFLHDLSLDSARRTVSRIMETDASVAEVRRVELRTFAEDETEGGAWLQAGNAGTEALIEQVERRA